VARALLLALGLAALTIAFLGLVDVQLVLAHTAPWWYIGLGGVALVLVALGSPRARPHEH
jgi:Na+-transporting NADH:ubiquinone oxidoreductase subunit NqrB